MRYSVLLLLCFCLSAFAGEISTGWYGSTAIQGYDATVYRGLASDDDPSKGDKSLVFEWKGAKWRFGTAEARNLFAAEPNKYAPQYGGHCANAMSLNKKVDSNAKIWMIHNDKLYLFAAEKGRKRWRGTEHDIADLIKIANENWRGLKEK